MYEYTVEIYFSALKAKDEESKVMGKIKLVEINQDEEDVDIEITCEKPGELAQIVKKILLKEMKEQVKIHI